MIRKKIREWLGIEAEEKTYWREKYLQENQIKHYASKINHLESRIKELEGIVAEDRLLTENNGSMIINYEKNYFPKLEEVLEGLEARSRRNTEKTGRLFKGLNQLKGVDALIEQNERDIKAVYRGLIKVNRKVETVAQDLDGSFEYLNEILEGEE